MLTNQNNQKEPTQQQKPNQQGNSTSKELGDFSYLFADPRVQNQMIPKFWRPTSSKQYIYSFIEQYLCSKPPGNSVPEIELRFGNFTLEQRNAEFRSNAYEKSTRDLSFQNPIIIGSTAPNIRKNLKMKPGQYCAIQGVEHQFKPGVDLNMFQNRIDVIEQLKNYDQKIEILTVDFSVKNNHQFTNLGLHDQQQQNKGQQNNNNHQNRPQGRTNKRITFDVTNKKFLETVKYEKNNLDIIHQNIDYRISAAYEENQDISAESFVKNVKVSDIQMARVKSRINFHFQFMEFSFTKVYTVTEKGLINFLFFAAKNSESKSPEECASYVLNQVVLLNPELEIEVEIINPGYLRSTMKNPLEFESVVNRFLRNSELLRTFPDNFYQLNYRELFQKQDQTHAMYPMIGEYLNTINAGDYYFRWDQKKPRDEAKQGSMIQEENEL